MMKCAGPNPNSAVSSLCCNAARDGVYVTTHTSSPFPTLSSLQTHLCRIIKQQCYRKLSPLPINIVTQTTIQSLARPYSIILIQSLKMLGKMKILAFCYQKDNNVFQPLWERHSSNNTGGTHLFFFGHPVHLVGLQRRASDIHIGKEI